MTVADIFWIFFMLSALQPVLRQRMLDAMRMRKIAQLERARNSRVILLVHRQETMRLLGFPIARYIDINDSEEVMRAIQMTDADVPLDIILHTPGGLVLAALQIARALRGHKAKVTAFVPHYAMSGGTLIALAADEIVMCRHAVLGPIDPQLGDSPAASLLKVVEEKPISEIDDKTLILADVGRKAIGQVKTAAGKLLDRHLPPEKADGAGGEIVDRHLDARLPDHRRGSPRARPIGQHRDAQSRARNDGALPAAGAHSKRRRRIPAGAAAEGSLAAVALARRASTSRWNHCSERILK